MRMPDNNCEDSHGRSAFKVQTLSLGARMMMIYFLTTTNMDLLCQNFEGTQSGSRFEGNMPSLLPLLSPSCLNLVITLYSGQFTSFCLTEHQTLPTHQTGFKYNPVQREAVCNALAYKSKPRRQLEMMVLFQLSAFSSILGGVGDLRSESLRWCRVTKACSESSLERKQNLEFWRECRTAFRHNDSKLWEWVN